MGRIPRVWRVALGTAIAVGLFVVSLAPRAPRGAGAVFRYDPRVHHPLPGLVGAAPERAVQAALQRQLARNAHYPQGSPGTVTAVQPELIEIATQNGGGATVHARLRYADGRQRVEAFHVAPAEYYGFRLPTLELELEYRFSYGPVQRCRPTSIGESLCE